MQKKTPKINLIYLINMNGRINPQTRIFYDMGMLSSFIYNNNLYTRLVFPDS